jgi:hypothetical protein
MRLEHWKSGILSSTLQWKLLKAWQSLISTILVAFNLIIRIFSVDPLISPHGACEVFLAFLLLQNEMQDP